jgi:hypothetical protein
VKHELIITRERQIATATCACGKWEGVTTRGYLTPAAKQAVLDKFYRHHPPKLLTCRWCKGVGHFPNKKTNIGSAVKKKQACHVCLGQGKFPAPNALDEEMFKHACHATWDAIAPDVGMSIEYVETGGTDVEKGISRAESMSLDDVVECVLDADHLETFGGREPAEKQRLRQLRLGLVGVRPSVAKKWAREALA